MRSAQGARNSEPAAMPNSPALSNMPICARHRTPHHARQGSKYSRKERLIWNMRAKLNSSPALYRVFLKAATRLRALTPSKVGPWTQNHSAPKPAARSLHDMAREHLAKKSGDPR